MSRFTGCDDDEAFPGEFDLYEATLRRALKGRKGQQFLRELREALLSLPDRKLIGGAMCTVGAGERRAALAAAADTEYAESVTWAAQQRAAGRRVWVEPELDMSKVADFDRKVQADGEGVCAGGAYLWHRKVRDGMDPAEAFASLPLLLGTYDDDGERSDNATADMLADAGRVARCIGWEIASANDEMFWNKTPEQRWQAFMDWIDRELGEVTSVA